MHIRLDNDFQDDNWVANPRTWPRHFLYFLLAAALAAAPSQCAKYLGPDGQAEQDEERQGPDYQAAYADDALRVEEKELIARRPAKYFLVVSADSGETWTVEVDKQVYDWLRVGDSYGKRSVEQAKAQPGEPGDTEW